MTPARLTLFGKVLNILLTPLDYLRLGWKFNRPIKLSVLKQQAANYAKLPPNFGSNDTNSSVEDDSTWYIEKYGIALDLLNKIRLTALGRFIATSGLRNRFVSRLKTRHAIEKAGTACTKQPINSPIFVLGLPRTGTTFLHRLLSLDPNTRCPMTYELFDPTLVVEGDLKEDARVRIEGMDKEIDTLRKIVPHLDDIHEIKAGEPEECILAMGVDVPLLPATFNLLMDKKDLVMDWDMAPVYRNYKQVLQLLQHQRTSATGAPAQRWVLKSPAHLGFIKYLKEAFPDAKLVWTHREPAESIPSLCSMFRTFQETFYAGDLNLREIGKRCSSFWEGMLAEAHKDLQGGDHEVQHVKYAEFIKEPLVVVQRLYKDFGWEYTDAFDQALKTELATLNAKRAARAKEKAASEGSESQTNQSGHLAHTYSMSEYGLDEYSLHSRISWYYDIYLNEKGDDKEDDKKAE
eukprot:CAMPEP_0114347974 /NCGR_PEP_ID=MMETSP0101-20121206/14357_1 /TAXON_ID=38822 ORGANISM="Pteridomonas danica, Strain PT" /NCGR_SAMPLE_ID=MMETSP0101 /ASSEMBLY_ACC=CAM_ASM_000211 /LENGTH=461 /DNA_ID=CAMNT_0001485661 /DNA_START=140 /DNA_END=1525 /DNA_ORIENTATION=+